MGNAPEVYEWERHVGRVVLAFGSIEHQTTACICALTARQVREAVVQLNLGLRLELLDGMLNEESPAEARMKAEIARVRGYLGRRNLVAHNALVLNFYRSGDSVAIEPYLPSARDPRKFLRYEDLIRLGDEVTELAQDFTKAQISVLMANNPETAELLEEIGPEGTG